MTYDMPYDEIVREAIGGKRVAVFCDNQTQAERCKSGIAAAARRMGAEKVVSPRRDRRVDIGSRTVRILLANGIDGRGMRADVVYLSGSARMQHEFASLMGAECR